ncbi:MAG: hypothetical protein MUC41_16030 [Syntrophobacteraceae bacterium]|nr:hypothetical protein [Syntrophobacteraceae bacterium]
MQHGLHGADPPRELFRFRVQQGTEATEKGALQEHQQGIAKRCPLDVLDGPAPAGLERGLADGDQAEELQERPRSVPSI